MAVAHLVLGRTPPWVGAAGGSVALSAGVVLLVIAAAADSSGALSLPVIAGGTLVGSVGVRPTFETFGSAVAALALVVAFQAWRTRPTIVSAPPIDGRRSDIGVRSGRVCRPLAR